MELYLREVVNRKDTRNSEPVVEFLNLRDFCPEIMFNVPRLLVEKNFARGRQYVNCCLFLEKHNLYVIAITDKSSKKSHFEIYSFRRTGLIQDQYKLKNTGSVRGTTTSPFEREGQRHSVVEILASPIARKNTFFSSISDTTDPKDTAEVRLPNGSAKNKKAGGPQI